MKDDEIVTLGKNADAYANNQTSDSFDWKLIRDARFAQLVAAAEREANARLIAAAPENLQSNSELATIVRELCAAHEHPLPEDALARSDAAIAKATGCEDSGQGSQKGTP